MKKNKKVPSFWWDFRGKYLIVESDDSEHPLIAVYPLVKEFADEEISMAEILIEDLNSGRKRLQKDGEVDKRTT